MTQIQLRRATAASWTSVNPILALGEMGIETDTRKIKVGDGVSQWGALDYFVYSWSEIPNKPTITSTPTAGAITLWDADRNLFANNHIDGFSTIVTANTTTTLTDASTKTQCFTGSTDHTLVMPSTGVVAGQQYMLINNSTGTINTLASNNGVIHVLGPSVECLFTALVDTPTLPTDWEDSFYGANFAAGKVLNVNTTLTLAGTDGTTFTFPGTSGTVVTLAATQSLSNKTLTSPTLVTPALGTPSSGTLSSCVGQVSDVSVVGFGASTARAVGTGDFPFGIKLQRAITFTSVTFRAATADSSGNLVVELRKNGTQVSGTPTTIAAASQVAGGTSTGTWSFAAGDILTVYVTAVGTTPGKGLIADITGLTT